MNNNLLTFKKEAQIGHLILSNPPKNEMTMAFFDQLAEKVQTIQSEPDLKGLILIAEGRHFSSGVNVNELLYEFQNTQKQKPEKIAENLQSFLAISDLPYPVVACIKGICMGSGFELALSAHFRLAAPNTLVSLPETGFGITPGLLGIYNTTKLTGSVKALEFILSGNSFTAMEAKQHKIIDKIVDKKDLIISAQHFIGKTFANYKKELKSRYITSL